MSTNPYQPPQSGGAPSAGKLPRDLGPVTGWITIVFSLQAILLLRMGLVFALDSISVETAFQDGGTPGLILFGMSALAWAALAWAALVVLGIVLFLIWIRRANMNAEALVSSGMEFTPGWAVGWFFVPFANLVKPYQAVAEIYRASNPDADPDFWAVSEVPAYLRVWWVSYLASNIVRTLNSRVPEFPGRMVFAIVQVALGCLAAGMVVVLVRSIHRLQLRKAAVH